MKKIVIHLFGASGSGTTTIGDYISETYGFFHMDTDKYFWECTNPPFTKKRLEEERLSLMVSDIEKHDKVIITGSLCGWGDSLIPYFSCAAEIIVPPDIRYKRIQIRELQLFGSRIMKGGDMYKQHKDFMSWAMNFEKFGIEHRSRVQHDAWKKLLQCPVISIDGTDSVQNITNNLFKCI